MAKLGSLLTKQKLKLLLIGDSGTGKTCATVTIQGAISIGDFDNKAISAAMYKGKTDPSVLDRVDVEQFGIGDKAAAYKSFRLWLSKLEAGKDIPDVITVDSLTLYSEALMAYVIKEVNPNERRAIKDVPSLRDYGVMNMMFKQDMGRLLAIDSHVICVAHSQDLKNEDGAVIGKKPLLSGQLVDYVPRIFHEVWWTTKMKDKEGVLRYMAITNHERYITRTQIQGLPNMIELDLGKVVDFINKGEK